MKGKHHDKSRISSLLSTLNIAIGAPSNKPAAAPVLVKKIPPPPPTLSTQSVEYRQRVQGLLDYIQFFVHPFEGKYMMSQVEKLISAPKLVEEHDPTMKTSSHIMAVLEKGLKVTGMDYYAWIEYCARFRENEEMKKCLWEDFLREMNQFKLSTKSTTITEEEIHTLFKFIAGDASDELYVDHCNMDLAAKKIHLQRDKLAHLSKAYYDVRLIGAFMRLESLHLGGQANALHAMLPMSEIEKLLHPIVWHYDWHVKEFGPIDLEEAGDIGEPAERSKTIRSNHSTGSTPKRNAGIRGSFSLRTFLGFNTVRSAGAESPEKPSTRKSERLGLNSFFKSFHKTDNKVYVSSEAEQPASPGITKEHLASSDSFLGEQGTIATGNSVAL